MRPCLMAKTRSYVLSLLALLESLYFYYLRDHCIYCHLLLTDKMAPVAAPLIILFQGSSFFLMCINVQSIDEKHPPHMAKLPPVIGARSFTAVKLPRNRLLIPCETKYKDLMVSTIRKDDQC